jgi:hypothetical protein
MRERLMHAYLKGIVLPSIASYSFLPLVYLLDSGEIKHLVANLGPLFSKQDAPDVVPHLLHGFLHRATQAAYKEATHPAPPRNSPTTAQTDSFLLRLERRCLVSLDVIPVRL